MTEPTLKSALLRSGFWIALAALFGLGVTLHLGTQRGMEFYTGYLLEQALSVDNLFVIALLFKQFRVPKKYQHRVLFWGIIGALIMRAILIAFAGALLGTLHWMIYVFGAFLILTGIRFLRGGHGSIDPESNRLLRFAKRLYPVTDGYVGQKFFVTIAGVRHMTPLFLVLLLVEFTDLVFAVDSIPAVYAITSDPFIVFTSNVMAILGLRSLYFVLAGFLAGLRYLKVGLAGVLVFVGVKMMLVDVYKIDPLVSLAVISTMLGAAIVASVIANRREAPHGGGDSHAMATAIGPSAHAERVQ
jgi:tellurite resistance protein TerC